MQPLDRELQRLSEFHIPSRQCSLQRTQIHNSITVVEIRGGTKLAVCYVYSVFSFSIMCMGVWVAIGTTMHIGDIQVKMQISMHPTSEHMWILRHWLRSQPYSDLGVIKIVYSATQRHG